MTKLKFTDGEEFDTSGNLRIEERFDGFYVVGQGMLIPVKDRAEAQERIQEIKKKNDRLQD